MSKSIALALAAAMALAVPSAVLADKGKGGGGQQPATAKVEGIITDGNVLTGQVAITTQGGVRVVVVVVPGTKLERNGRMVPLTAFRNGDRAQAEFLATGVAVKLEAVGPWPAGRG